MTFLEEMLTKLAEAEAAPDLAKIAHDAKTGEPSIPVPIRQAALPD